MLCFLHHWNPQYFSICLILKPISSGGQEQLILCVRTLSTEGSCSSVCRPATVHDKNMLLIFVFAFVSTSVSAFVSVFVSVSVSRLRPGKTAAVCVPTCYRRAVHEKCILSDSWAPMTGQFCPDMSCDWPILSTHILWLANFVWTHSLTLQLCPDVSYDSQILSDEAPITMHCDCTFVQTCPLNLTTILSRQVM